MNFKKTIEKLLIHSPPLYRLASRAYHLLDSSFHTLSPGTGQAIRRALKQTQQENLTGDYYEFGLFQGYTFAKAWQHSQALKISNIHFWGFDSFEGLPTTKGIDKVDPRFFAGQFKCTMDHVRHNLSNNGVVDQDYTLIKGFYDQTLLESLHKKHNFAPASVILYDCDLYESTLCALKWSSYYFQPGTILLFDDWFAYDGDESVGQAKAFDDFFKTHNQLLPRYIWHFSKYGKSFQLC